ncbi:MAG: hypothetical protein AcusKO_50470 [Acuticoccus sp.]
MNYSGSGITNVSDIGYYALGIFVGAVISFALVKVDDWSKPLPIVTGLVGAAVSGVIMVLLEKIGGSGRNGDAIALYPVGLANALVWIFVHHSDGVHKRLYTRATMIVTVIIITLLLIDPVVGELKDIHSAIASLF